MSHDCDCEMCEEYRNMREEKFLEEVKKRIEYVSKKIEKEKPFPEFLVIIDTVENEIYRVVIEVSSCLARVERQSTDSIGDKMWIRYDSDEEHAHHVAKTILARCALVTNLSSFKIK